MGRRSVRSRSLARAAVVSAAALVTPAIGVPAAAASPVGGPECYGVGIAPGSSPAGYLPLNVFGGTQVLTLGDDASQGLTVPSFDYHGNTYTEIQVDSNGYLVVGPGPDTSTI